MLHPMGIVSRRGGRRDTGSAMALTVSVCTQCKHYE